MTIRTAEEADVPWLVELANLPAIEQSLARIAPRSAEALGAEVAAGDRYVLLAADGSPAGMAGLRVVHEIARLASLFGVAVHPDHHGEGIARRGVAELVAHAFDDLGVHRIEVEAYGYNDAAIGLFRAMGFSEEGVRRQAWRRFDRWQDGIRFAVLSDDPRPH